MSEPVVVVDYDSSWPSRFESLRAPIAAALGEVAVAVEHVGSTAVPGLAAKPILDVDVVVSDVDAMPHAVARLVAIGYVHQGDLGVPGREAFAAPPGSTPHHLYVCAAGTSELRRHLAFRDYLRANPMEARAYAEIKKSAAERFRHDRTRYTEAKSAFVHAALQRASSEGGSDRTDRGEDKFAVNVRQSIEPAALRNGYNLRSQTRSFGTDLSHTG